MADQTTRESSVQEDLVDIWRVVLRDENLDAASSFLAAGGTSLTALRLRAGIRQVLGRDLEVIDVYENPTPAALAPLVSQAPEWVDDTDDELDAR